MNGSAAAVTRAQASYERAKETGSKLRGGGTMAIAGAGAAGYAGGRFLAPAVGFDEEMSRVQALTRLDKGDSQLAALRAQAKSSARKRHLPPATPQVVRRSLQWLASLHNQSRRHYLAC